MIIIGYQGIGKSTLANKNIKFIDLESTNFFVDGKRDDNWYKIYLQIATHLSRQGYTVFVSSHKVVRDALNNIIEPIAACYPAIHLKEPWIAKLLERYNNSGLDKDFRALMNAKDRYEHNIREIMDDCDRYGFKEYIIDRIDYDLESVLSK